MSLPLTSALLSAVMDNLAGSDWPNRYLHLIIAREGNGVVTGAADHFASLKVLSRLDLGHLAVPARFCLPSDSDE